MSFGDVKTALSEVVLEFLEVAIHNILYVKKLYPDSIFVPKKKYGVTVYQAIHPEVAEYIRNCFRAVAYHAKKNQLKRLFVCFEEGELVKERFVFDVLMTVQSLESDIFLVELEEFLRIFMLKLHSSEVYLSDLACDSTFSIRLETINSSNLEFNNDPSQEDFPWIRQDTSEEISEDSTSIVPLHALATDFLKLQVYVEK